MAKLYCSEMAGRVADRAVQIFGGRGYMRENVAERMFRELRVERIWEGASEIQRIIVGRQLMTRGPGALLDLFDGALPLGDRMWQASTRRRWSIDLFRDSTVTGSSC